MPLVSKSTGIKNASLMTIKRLSTRFIIRDSGCWQWIGYTPPPGYGRFTVNGRPKSAHRVVWELIGNPVDPNLELDHLCKNKACVNPSHLEAVSHAVNTQRRYGIGLCKRGHKLTDNNVVMDIKNKKTNRLGRQCKTCKRMMTKKWNAKGIVKEGLE